MKRRLPDRLETRRGSDPSQAPESGADESPECPPDLGEEERTRSEWQRLQGCIEDRKKVARDSDISYHLWGLYRSHFRTGSDKTPGPRPAAGEWYDVEILSARAADGVSRYAFRLKGRIYSFADDEEKQGWRENLKLFSLFLFDDEGRCLIEVPMKMRVDSEGRNYSISSDGPRAFLPGGWINDFINVRLKNQSMRNREIRAQKHEERLREIEDLKNRFGLED